MKQNNRRNDKNRKSLWDRFVSIFFEEVPYDEIDFESLDRAFAEAEKKEKPKKTPEQIEAEIKAYRKKMAEKRKAAKNK